MSCLIISDLSKDNRDELFPQPKVVAMPFGNKVIRNDVRKYCESKGLSEVNTLACIEIAVLAHLVEAGTKTADRLVVKNSVRKFRHNHFDGPKDAA